MEKATELMRKLDQIKAYMDNGDHEAAYSTESKLWKSVLIEISKDHPYEPHLTVYYHQVLAEIALSSNRITKQ